MRISKSPDERRTELLNAARELFDRNGMANTKVSDIVKQVGVSQGIFYYYFKSKEEIEQVIIRQVIEEIQGKLNGIVKSGKSLYQKLSMLILLYLDVIDQFTGDDEDKVTEKDDKAIHQAIMEEEGHGMLTRVITELIEQAVADKTITLSYPKETVEILFFGIRTYYTYRIPSKQMVFTIVEQTLHLPEGALVNLSHNNGNN